MAISLVDICLRKTGENMYVYIYIYIYTHMFTAALVKCS